MRAPIAYVIMKTIIVETYDNHPKYATPDDKMRTKSFWGKILEQSEGIQLSTK